MSQIVPVLEKVASEGGYLLIISKSDIQWGSPQAALILNIIRGALEACVVKSSWVWE